MADIRIKDLPETLDVGAEDYVAVDNTADGTRKFTLRQLVASVGAPEFVVNVNASGEADKTLSEINTAISNGYVPVVLYDGGYYQLAETTETAATFTKCAGPSEMAEISITSSAVRIETNALTSDDIDNSSGVIGENVSDALDNLAYNITNFSESVSDIRDDISDLDTRVTTLENEGGGGSGLTDDVKTALLQIAQKIAYIDAHGQDYYDDLYDALYNDTTRSVLLVLSHVSSSNTQSTVEVGDSYTTTLTASTNYTLNSVSVTMGGVDITSTAYSSGTVSIPSVTGNIVITATAVLAAQSITATYTQSGTVYDTDSLDSLKADLVVTANYSGGTSETVPASDYTLSGTLTEGTSTVTVSYAGLTTTFNVTVTHEATYVQTGLIHRWDGIDNTLNGHDGSTTTWYDLVGTDHLLMNQSVLPTWETNALSFPKTAGQRLLGTNDAESVGTQTIELCFLPSESHTAGLFIPLGNTTIGKMCIYSDNTFGVNGASGNTYQNPESAITELNHIAVVIENGTITSVYGNATVASLSTKTHSFADPYTKRVLGQANERSNSTAYPFKGKIFSARIYNRALSASEIASNYDTDLTRFGLGE